MKISIITVCYNAADTICDAMESVARQKVEGASVECLVVDGGSADGTVDKVREFSRQVHASSFAFRWVSEKDNGLYDAMNKGIRMATGDVIGIVNSDDMIAADDVLAKVAERFKRDEDLDFLYSDVRFVARETRLANLHDVPTKRYVCPVFWHPWMLTFGYAPPHPGMYIRKRCFDKFGLYKYDYRIGADYEMTVRFTRRQGVKCAYLRKCTVAMRLGGASTKEGNAGSFVGNNYDVIRANRENGYWGNRFLVLGKLPVKALELIVPRLVPHIGAQRKKEM